MPRKQKTKSKKSKGTKQKQKQKQSVNVKVNIDQSQRGQPFRSSPSIMGGSHTVFLPAHINQPVNQNTQPLRENIPVSGFVATPQLSDTVPDYGSVRNGSIVTEQTHALSITPPFEPPQRARRRFDEVPVGRGNSDNVSVLSDGFDVFEGGEDRSYPQGFDAPEASVTSNLSSMYGYVPVDDESAVTDDSSIGALLYRSQQERRLTGTGENMVMFEEDRRSRQMNQLIRQEEAVRQSEAEQMGDEDRLSFRVRARQNQLDALQRGRETQASRAEQRRQQTARAREAQARARLADDEE
jgi:hypothetical protein